MVLFGGVTIWEVDESWIFFIFLEAFAYHRSFWVYQAEDGIE